MTVIHLSVSYDWKEIVKRGTREHVCTFCGHAIPKRLPHYQLFKANEKKVGPYLYSSKPVGRAHINCAHEYRQPVQLSPTEKSKLYTHASLAAGAWCELHANRDLNDEHRDQFQHLMQYIKTLEETVGINRVEEEIMRGPIKPTSDDPYFGELRTIEVWSEGYAATGDSGTAQLLGTYKAKTLKDAVHLWVRENPDERWKYIKEHEDGSITYWGCRIFDNEYHARRQFG